ncbi:MAG: putative zinc-binding metallopeptidase [Odoribacteraceae bacterium]|jgi:hypothetical protein|nr:putative zinc-binding metallopeptidase [Odoribacteraceae bacterium]
MKHTYTIIIAAALLLLAPCHVACNGEEDLIPRVDPENVYGDPTLPQGDHDYDAFILDFFRKYNTLMLYKYDPQDIYWNITNNSFIPVVRDSVGNVAVAGYVDTPADENYVGEQIELIREKFLAHYPDDFLREMLPKKIFLLRSFVEVSKTNVATDRAPAAGIDYLLFQWGGEEIRSIAPAQVNDFKSKASEVFLRRLVASGKIQRDPAFLSITNYGTPGSGNAARLENGFITPSAITEAADWDAYLYAIVYTPYDTLVKPRGSLSATDFVNRRGVLTPEYDVSGKIRQKYWAMVDYFKDAFNVDLQAIGNDREP